jgi:hypothetical protein
MKHFSRFFFTLFSVSLLVSTLAHAQQPWSNILSSSRAIDWKNAGLPATFPDGETTPNPWTPPTRPACTSAQAGITVPVAPGTSFATIITAMANCFSANPTGSYLQLGAGAFTLTSNATMGKYVTLRGSGPMSTTLTISGGAQLNFGGGSIGGGTLNASPAAGATSVTVTGVSGASPAVNQLAWFNQCDSGFSGSAQPTKGYNSCPTGSITDNGYVFVCGGSTLCNSNGTGSGSGGQASQSQTAIITSVTNNGGGSYTIGFNPGLYLTNWATANTAALYWQSGNSGFGSGLEDMTIVMGGGGNNEVQMGGYGNWIKGVRFLGNTSAAATIIFGGQTKGAHGLFFNNYMFGATPSSMTSNGFQTSLWNAGDFLILNNVAEQGLFMEGHGSEAGDVLAYNYSKNVSTNYVQSTDYQHDNNNSGVAFILNEGNQVNSIIDDGTWGTGDLNTFFRNWASCDEEPYVYSSTTGNGIAIDAFHRFDNAVANVLGGTVQCNAYSGTSNGDIFRIDKQGTDILTGTSFLRWANYDTVNAAVRCQSSEVPTILSDLAALFGNFLPSTPAVCGGSGAIPASFYMDSITAHPSGGTGLSWWKVCTSWTTFPTACATYTTEPFPAAGPDVTGGNYISGHAYDNPAHLAWRMLPIDTTQQNSYTITGSSWASGTETLTVSGLPSGTQLMGPLQISGGNCATSGAGTATGAEVTITGSTTTTISYALAANPGTCTGTMLWPDVRQFDERVYTNDSSGTVPNPPTGVTGSIIQ